MSAIVLRYLYGDGPNQVDQKTYDGLVGKKVFEQDAKIKKSMGRVYRVRKEKVGNVETILVYALLSRCDYHRNRKLYVEGLNGKSDELENHTCL